MNDAVTAYLHTWNSTDAKDRAALLARHWTPKASYTDPLAEAVGHEAIGATIDAVHDQFPGFVFTAVGEPDMHHRQVRFQWGLGPADAEPVVIGFDVMVTDGQGRIETVLGFLDKVPS